MIDTVIYGIRSGYARKTEKTVVSWTGKVNMRYQEG